MKKLISLLLVIAMLTICTSVAFADSYYSENLECEIALPEGLYVKDETTEGDTIMFTIGMNGRDDVGYGIRFSYYEDYEDYCTNDLPEEMLKQLQDYYLSVLDCSNYAAPEIQDWSEGDEDYAELNPLMVCGVNENGELMLYYELIYYGTDILVFGGTTADTFDEETGYAAYSLFFSALDLLFEGEE